MGQFMRGKKGTIYASSEKDDWHIVFLEQWRIRTINSINNTRSISIPHKVHVVASSSQSQRNTDKVAFYPSDSLCINCMDSCG